METLSAFAPRPAGVLEREPEVTFLDSEQMTQGADFCPITMCASHCVGTHTG
ncbi:hypothetical protein [Streptomyces chattanoogensis]|uniref:hypothetical protein n=1 Tax=Streptomyces chattanoogensis TaxID=66876 RepID=UPI0005D815FA|nr:hypothetical protein T261_7367 [Streptomyces lydicus]